MRTRSLTPTIDHSPSLGWPTDLQASRSVSGLGWPVSRETTPGGADTDAWIDVDWTWSTLTWTPSPRSPSFLFHVKQRSPDPGTVADPGTGEAVDDESAVSRETSAELREELVATIPEAGADTPLAQTLAQDARRRIALTGRRLPSPPIDARPDRGEPEGGRRQDHHDGERRRRPGPVRAQGARHRPRPAGQRQHRAGRRPPRRGAQRLRRARRRQGVRRGHRAVPDRRGTVLRAGHHRPGRRRDRAGLAGGARDAARPCARHDHLARRPTSTTSSSTARRASDCSPSTPSSPPPRCSSRSSASTTRSRACRSCSRTSS